MQFFIAEESDGFDALSQIAPKRLDIVRAGETACHSDYGDIKFCIFQYFFRIIHYCILSCFR